MTDAFDSLMLLIDAARSFLGGFSLAVLIFGIPVLLAILMIPILAIANWNLERKLRRQGSYASSNIKFKPKGYKGLPRRFGTGSCTGFASRPASTSSSNRV